jgi:hypothetical protein
MQASPNTHTAPNMNTSPAMQASTIVMQAKGLVKRYGQVTALDGADLSCAPAKSWR